MQTLTDYLISTVSLDYDGCGSILFNKNKENIASFVMQSLSKNLHLQSLMKKNETYLKSKIDLFITLAQNMLQTQIDKYFKNSQRCLFLVGSNRQDPTLDLFNSTIHKNHLSFQLFREYSEERGLEFCELLLGDVYDSQGNKREEMLPVGTTMQTAYPSLPEDTSIENLQKYLIPYCLSPVSSNKILLIQTQIDYIAKITPAKDQKTLFVFIDDRQDLIDDVEKNLVIPEHIEFKAILFAYLPILRNLLIKELQSLTLSNTLKRSHEEASAQKPLFSCKKTNTSSEETQLPQPSI